MIIDHTHPLYAKKRRAMSQDGKYNGAYYYSKDIVKYIIPNVKTDRKWVTVRLGDCTENLDHSIVFIHNNLHPEFYEYLSNYKDLLLYAHKLRLAGVPKDVTLRAKSILKALEKNDLLNGKKPLVFEEEETAEKQLTEVEQTLMETDINTLSPMQAFMLLNDLKEKLLEEN